MQRKPTKLALALAGILALTVAGCGGGGGTSASSTTTTTTTATTSLSGVAATGAAFTDATVTVMDSRGQSVGSGTVGADGTFTITLAAGAVAPFILTATRTSADGATESLVSVVPTGTGTTAAATVNISPVTNLIASRLSSSGDPTKLGAELAAGTSTVNATTVAATVADVQTILAPILTATGTTGTDPLTGTFAADGTGYDRLLDSIKVTITPASATATNVEIGIKQLLAEGTAPTTIQFNNGAGQTAVASVPAIPAITSNTLVPSGTAVLIAQHLAQLTSCYALPLATRVPSGTVATSIAATECTSAFFNNSPASFKSNGNVVGLGKAFNGIFTTGGNGVAFSQGTYEFTRANGDIVVSYKSTTLAGNETFDTFALRLDTDGKLKQIGNQYDYAGGVNPYQQLREFVTQPASNYYSTGYNISIPLINAPTVISYVEITTPRNTTLTMIRGSDSMVFPRGGNLATPSGTNYLRIRSEYATTTGAPAGHPSTIEGGLMFVPSDFTDAQVVAIPNQAVWTFNYYSGTVGSGTLQATQYYKTRTRANSLAELRNQTWATLGAATIADMQTKFIANSPLVNGPTAGYSTLSSSANLAPTWNVPTGALPPTEVKLFGSALYFDYTNSTTKAGNTGFTSTTNSATYTSGRTNFNDGQTVGSTARSTTIACANGGVDANNMGEKHCNNPGYLATARNSGVHLWARDTTGREYAHFYATYALQ